MTKPAHLDQISAPASMRSNSKVSYDSALSLLLVWSLLFVAPWEGCKATLLDDANFPPNHEARSTGISSALEAVNPSPSSENVGEDISFNIYFNGGSSDIPNQGVTPSFNGSLSTKVNSFIAVQLSSFIVQNWETVSSNGSATTSNLWVDDPSMKIHSHDDVGGTEVFIFSGFDFEGFKGFACGEDVNSNVGNGNQDQNDSRHFNANDAHYDGHNRYYDEESYYDDYDDDHHSGGHYGHHDVTAFEYFEKQLVTSIKNSSTALGGFFEEVAQNLLIDGVSTEVKRICLLSNFTSSYVTVVDEPSTSSSNLFCGLDRYSAIQSQCDSHGHRTIIFSFKKGSESCGKEHLPDTIYDYPCDYIVPTSNLGIL